MRYCCNAHLEDKIRLSADRRMHNLIHLRRCLISVKPCAATFNSESCRVFFFFFFLGQTVVLGHICVGTMSSGLLYCIYVTGASLVWLRRLRILLQCRRHEFNPWVGKISWRRKWQPTPVFLPGKSHGQKSLVGYSPWCSKRLDRPE